MKTYTYEKCAIYHHRLYMNMKFKISKPIRIYNVIDYKHKHHHWSRVVIYYLHLNSFIRVDN